MKMQSADGWPASGAIVSFRLVGRSVLLQLPFWARHLREPRGLFISCTHGRRFFLLLLLLVLCVVVVVYIPPLKNITAHACPIADCSVRSSSHLWVLLLLLFLLIWFFLQQRLLRTCRIGGGGGSRLFSFSVFFVLVYFFTFSRLLLNCRETPVVISPVLFSMWNDLRSRPFLWWRAPVKRPTRSYEERSSFAAAAGQFRNSSGELHSPCSFDWWHGGCPSGAQTHAKWMKDTV